MTNADLIAAIRRQHLKANIADFPPEAQHWDEAWIDPGGTIFGEGPYVKLPVDWCGERVVIRVYPTARLRRRLCGLPTTEDAVKDTPEGSGRTGAHEGLCSE